MNEIRNWNRAVVTMERSLRRDENLFPRFLPHAGARRRRDGIAPRCRIVLRVRVCGINALTACLSEY
jgi:hypothetical protein